MTEFILGGAGSGKSYFIAQRFIMKLPKYMRIQGREIAYRTQKPVGIFVLNWRRIRDGVYSAEDAEIYEKTHKWFLENLPQFPPESPQ